MAGPQTLGDDDVRSSRVDGHRKSAVMIVYHTSTLQRLQSDTYRLYQAQRLPYHDPQLRVFAATAVTALDRLTGAGRIANEPFGPLCSFCDSSTGRPFASPAMIRV